MSLKNLESDTKNFTEVKMEDNIRLIITSKAYSKISYLLQKIHDVEWSALLMYKVKGHIDNPKEMLCTVEDIYLMDKGTKSSTSHKYENEDVVEAFEDYPEYLNMKIGHLHSHNTMKSFFSGTDNQELHDNAPNHLYYLSLIVNNEGQFVAKLCYIGKREYRPKISLKNRLGNWIKRPYFLVEEDILVIHDCDISIKFSNAIKFHERLKKITDKKKENNNYKFPDKPYGDKYGYDQQYYTRGYTEDYTPFNKYPLDKVESYTPAKNNYEKRIYLLKILISGDMEVSKDSSLSDLLQQVNDLYNGFSEEDISDSFMSFSELSMENSNFIVDAYSKVYGIEIENPINMSKEKFEEMSTELENCIKLIPGKLGEGITIWVDNVLSEFVLEREGKEEINIKDTDKWKS